MLGTVICDMCNIWVETVLHLRETFVADDENERDVQKNLG